MTALILVGESNPWGADPAMALYPLPTYTAGGRMQRIVLGIKRHRYVELDRYNLCVGRFSMPVARANAAELLHRHTDGVFVLLGRKVATAFGAKDIAAFSTIAPQGRHGRTLILLPHPSGRNRIWQTDPDAVAKCRQLIALACPDLPLGEI